MTNMWAAVAPIDKLVAIRTALVPEDYDAAVWSDEDNAEGLDTEERQRYRDIQTFFYVRDYY